MTMHPVLIVVVYALAVARVTRMITADRITAAPRRWLSIRLWTPRIQLADVERRQFDNAHWARQAIPTVRRQLAQERYDDGAEQPLTVYLLACSWCASIYVSAAAAPLAYFWGTSAWLFVPALALAFSYVAGFLAGKE